MQPLEPDNVDYEPTHPWYYLNGGTPPEPEAIGPADIAQAKLHNIHLPYSISKSLPDKQGVKRRAALPAALESARQMLAKTIARYRDVLARGPEALSAFDRTIAHDDDRMAVASALSMMNNHIANEKAVVLFLEAELFPPEPVPLPSGQFLMF